MKEDLHLRLQAYFDGELSEPEAREVESWLACDDEARALLAELRNTRGALGVFETETRLPESREFHWSKIRREIERQEKAEAPRPAASALAAWRRFFVPAGAFAALAIAGLLAAHQFGWIGGGRPTEMETALADSGAVIYRDQAEQTTLVWLSYPAENEFAETDADSTIQ